MTTLVLIASLLVLVALAAAAKARPQHGTAAPQVASHYHTRPALKHSPRFLVARALNRGLAGTPMRTLGFELEAAGFRYHVSPAFIAAAAGVESSFGAASCRDNVFNAYGLASCDPACRQGSRSWVPCFGSWHQSIVFFARWYRTRWSIFTDVWTVGRSYCPPCGDRWGSKVASYMRGFGFGPAVAYGAVSAVA